jgi:hypothetical protein
LFCEISQEQTKIKNNTNMDLFLKNRVIMLEHARTLWKITQETGITQGFSRRVADSGEEVGHREGKTHFSWIWF